MRNKISSGKNSVFSQHQSFLISLLEQEIAFHYKLDEGRAGVSFGRDPVLNEAGKLLADASAFKKILSSSHVPAAKP
jgi:carboxyl-terminal processing protease